jgi:putative hydrolase of the HAD superfamily
MAEAAPIVRVGTRVPLALFDLDNTLFDRAGTYRRWATAFVADAGLSSNEVEWFVDADRDGLASRSDVWSAAKQRYGLAGTVDELLARYRDAYLDCCLPDTRVHESLLALRTAGWRTGIVTNGSMPQQANKATRLGLLPLVDGFCASGELEVEKPDPLIFAEAVRRCSLSPTDAGVQAAWMVGDAPVADVGGGRSFGLATIWLHRGRTWNAAHGDPPTIAVDSVTTAVRAILSPGPPELRRAN